MPHITFYRKYRSQTFGEIVGQTHIVQTLSNAIQNDRLSHAYIFSGPRGTGKTSTARILAKSLNCRNGKSITPCGVCDLCQKITQGSSIDIIEIDAASNTGVDNIRTLNDQVNFTPIECTYKIYIIDEAHMLSSGAFNALLKTLEEPPANTVFIFATTEPHKIPITIHSRCQHLQFRMMTTAETITQLSRIAQSEGLTIDDNALKLIARNAGGSMRDAVSLLDQMASFKGNIITYTDVITVLGGMNTDELVPLIGDCLQKNTKEVVRQLDHIAGAGCNITQLTQELILIVKDMILLNMKLDNAIEGDQGYKDLLKKAMASASFNDLSTLLETLAKTELDLKWFPRQELLLQVRLLSTMSEASLPAVQNAPQPQQVLQQVPQQAQLKKVSTPFVPSPAPQQSASPQQVTQPAQATQSAPDHVLWNSCIDKIKVKKQSLYSILKDSNIIERQSNYIKIALKQDFKFFREKLKEASNQQVIQDTLHLVFGQPLSLQLSTAEPTPAQTTPTEISYSAPETKVIPQNENPQAMKINHIIQLFDGTLIS
jgi:DNA polymerase-3 subunit gamma/tau